MSGTGSLLSFLRGFTIWRVQSFNSTRGKRFGVYLTRWFFLTNFTFPGEQRFYVRFTEHWGRSFGGTRG